MAKDIGDIPSALKWIQDDWNGGGAGRKSNLNREIALILTLYKHCIQRTWRRNWSRRLDTQLRAMRSDVPCVYTLITNSFARGASMHCTRRRQQPQPRHGVEPCTET